MTTVAPRPVRRPPPHPAVAATVGLVVITAYSGALLWAMTSTSYDVWGGLVVGPVLVAVTVPIARRVAARDADPLLLRIIVLALLAKLAATLVRYYVGFEVYDGAIDAREYMDFGVQLAEQFRHGVFDVELGREVFVGTAFTRLFTGLVFALLGNTAIGAFLFFGWLCFCGQILLYRAFRIAVPDGDHRRYGLLLFFLPSLLYWPSAVGKDALMIFGLGLAAYGLARVLARLHGGYVVAAAGVAATALVRPHVSALFCASAVAAYALRRSSAAGRRVSVGKIVGLGVLMLGLLVVVQQTERYFGIEERSPEAVGELIDETAERTATGGSQYEARRPRTLLEVPLAAFSVMFRPLPHETHNPQALFTSLEGVLLLGLFLLALPRMVELPRQAWRTPYVAFAVVYTGLFVVAFSSFGNFGILARQRVQLFPFVLVLLALPALSARNSRARGAARA